MADLEFNGGGTSTPRGVSSNLLFGKIFAENCMKNERNWTELGGGRHIPSAPLGSAYGFFTLHETRNRNCYYGKQWVLVTVLVSRGTSLFPRDS